MNHDLVPGPCNLDLTLLLVSLCQSAVCSLSSFMSFWLSYRPHDRRPIPVGTRNSSLREYCTTVLHCDVPSHCTVLLCIVPSSRLRVLNCAESCTASLVPYCTRCRCIALHWTAVLDIVLCTLPCCGFRYRLLLAEALHAVRGYKLLLAATVRVWLSTIGTTLWPQVTSSCSPWVLVFGHEDDVLSDPSFSPRWRAFVRPRSWYLVDETP
jgi:hypothetical protein